MAGQGCAAADGGHPVAPGLQERGPPKTLSVQMSLTPQLLPMHPSQGRTVSASGGPPGEQPAEAAAPPSTAAAARLRCCCSPHLHTCLQGYPCLAIRQCRAGVLEPLVVGKPGFRRRVRQLMEAMGLDLVQRVLEDSAEEGGRCGEWRGLAGR